MSWATLVWPAIKAYWRPLAVAAVLLAIAAGVGWYGHSQYRAGYVQAKAEAKVAAVSLEQGMQYERDRADAQYRGAVLAREAAQHDLVAVRGQLDGLLRTHGRSSANPRARSGPDDTSPDWIGGFATCYGDYADLVTDAARWADQVNGLQGYVRAIGAAR